MTSIGSLPVRLSAIAVAVALTTGWSPRARADIYGFAEQRITNYVFTGATVGVLSPQSSTSAVQVGVPSGSQGQIGTFDPLESYVGPGPRPPENFFGQVGAVNPDYSRGDVLITGFTAGSTGPPTTDNVAETDLRSPGSQSSAIGAWSISAPITVTSPGSVTLSGTYTNLLNLINTQAGISQASYAFEFSIRSGNTLVFDATPNALNNTVSISAPGSVLIPGSGSFSVTSGTLAAGTYSATITGSERVFASASVPEPSPLVMAGLGAGVCLAYGGFRSKRAAAPVA